MASESDRGSRSLLRDPRVVVARRDLSSLSREKTIVLALLIQLFVAAFSSFLVFGLSSLYDPSSVDSEAIVVGVSGEASDDLEAAAAEVPDVGVTVYEDRTRAGWAFDNGTVHGLLHGRYVEATDDGGGRTIQVTATAPEGSVRSTLIVVQLRAVLESLERRERIERSDDLERTPLQLPEEVQAPQYYGFTYTVLVPLLLFLPPFISGSVAVDSVTEEIERGTLALLRAAPVSLVDVVDGKALAMVAIAPAQALLWILLLSANGIAVANAVPVLAFVTAVTVVVVALGLALGVTFRQRKSAQLLYSVLALVVFAVAVFAPEHPTTTVARLAVDSPTWGTFGHVAAAVVLAVVAYAGTRRYVAGIDADSL